MSSPEALPRILVVDDSRMVRASILKGIRGRFDAREEVDGEAGWEALLVDPSLNLVLTDIDMPRLDGFGLLERIRSSKVARVRDLPVVIISGDEDESARERALGLGANGFISKGVGNVELLATLNSLLRLSQTQNELERSREALARSSTVDSEGELLTDAYFDHHGAQLLTEAQRRQSDVAAMVIELDDHEGLAAQFGSHVVPLIVRRLSRMVMKRIRGEDSVSQRSPTQFALLSPAIDMPSSCAFALRLASSIEKLVLAYRDEHIRVTVTIGVANSAVDGLGRLSELLEVATQRIEQGRAQGGNCVIAPHGRVDQAWVDSNLTRPFSVDRALHQLRLGREEEVVAQLPKTISSLMPLLELIESQLHCALPLERLERFLRGQSEFGGDASRIESETRRGEELKSRV